MNDETVSVPKGELKEMMDQIANLTKVVQTLQGKDGAGAETRSVRKRKEKKVTIAMIDNMPVIGMRNRGDEYSPMYTWTEIDPKDPRKEVMYTDLVVRNMETNKEEVIERVNYLQFMDNGGKKECLVIKQTGEEWEKENGVVTKMILPDGDKYQMEDLDIDVPDVVLGTVFTYVVDFGGKALEVHENYVNIIK